VNIRVKKIVMDLVGVILISTACVFSSAFSADVDYDKSIHSINVPAMNAADALNKLAYQTGTVLLFPYQEAKVQQANSVIGEYTLKQAITILLKDSGLVSSLTEDGAIRISIIGDQRQKKTKGREDMNAKKNILASAVAFFVGGGVVAQEVDPTASEQGWLMEEIVVTASRREESLQNLGMAVSVVDPVEFTAVGLTKLSDVIAYTPGITVTNANGVPDGAQLSIRGVGPQVSGANIGATVAVYMDSTSTTDSSPYGSAGLFAFDGLLGAVERVEFLRGPQGTLYGSSALGGAIKYITRKPSLEVSSGHLSADVSSTKEGGISQLYSARFTAPIIDNKLGFTFAGFFDDDRGYVDRVDTITGNLLKEDADQSERYGFSADLYYQHSDRIDFRVRALEQKVDYTGTSIIGLDPLTNKPIHGDFEGTQDPTTTYNESILYSGVLGVQFDGATLAATSSYVENERFTGLDITTPFVLGLYSPGAPSFSLLAANGRTFVGPATAFSATDVRGSKKFTQEFQLTSEASETVEWVVGLYYVDEETFLLSDNSVQPDGFTVVVRDSRGFYEEIAAFGNLTYFITPEFDLTVGTRLSRNELTLNVETLVSNIGPPPPVFEAPIKDTVDVWSLIARYRPVEELSLYARAASGYRPAFANANTVSVFDPSLTAPAKVEADSLWSYEIGVKGELVEGLLNYDVALWTLKWDDYQASVSVAPGFNPRINASSGIKGKGLEASFSYSPFEGFSILTNLAYTEMTLDKDDLRLNGTKGQQLPRVPEWTASSRANYTFALGDEVDVNLGLGIRYEDSSRSTLTDAEAFVPGAIPPPGLDSYNVPSDSYVVVDANAGLTWNQATLSLYSTNLLNKKALTNTSGSRVSALAVPLQPRTVGVRLSMDF
jgi:iron complex outermembrane receptor protein